MPLQNLYKTSTPVGPAHGRVSPLRFPGIEPAVSPRRWSLRCATSGRPPTHTRPFSRPLPPRQLLCWQQHSSSLGAVTSEAQLSCKRGESAQRKHCNRASARRWDVNGPWVWPRATKRPRTAGGDRVPWCGANKLTMLRFISLQRPPVYKHKARPFTCMQRSCCICGRSLEGKGGGSWSSGDEVRF